MDPQLQEAYVAVERAYSQGQYPSALERAQQLARLVPEGTPDQLALRLRLLTAHIHLYGLQQPALALPLYQQVLEQSSDPTYQELARQGIGLSSQLTAAADQPASPPAEVATTPPPAPAALDNPFAAAPASSAETAAGAAAMPWLTDLGAGGAAAAMPAPPTPDAPFVPFPMGEPTATPAEPAPAQAVEPGEDAAASAGPTSPDTAPEGSESALVPREPQPAAGQAPPEPLEPELIEPELLEPQPPSAAQANTEAAAADARAAHVPNAFSPAEAAELAKGLLLVKLA